MGSEANQSPKLLRAEETSKQLIAVNDEGSRSLLAFFDEEKAVGGVGCRRTATNAYGIWT